MCLCIKESEVRGWCMNFALEILQDQWGFDVTPLHERKGPPVPTDASLDKKVVPHLYACLYDMGETEAKDRDDRLLGNVGPRRAPLQLVPPRRLTIPHPIHGSMVVWLTWKWPKSPYDGWLASGSHSRGEDEVSGGDDAARGGDDNCCKSVASSHTSVRQPCARALKKQRKARGRESSQMILGGAVGPTTSDAVLNAVMKEIVRRTDLEVLYVPPRRALGLTSVKRLPPDMASPSHLFVAGFDGPRTQYAALHAVR